jgi:hypothetical protein
MSRLLTMRGLPGNPQYDGLDRLFKTIKNKLGDELSIVEVGSYQGESTEIMSKNFPDSKINAVDIWEKYIEDISGNGTITYSLENQELELIEAEDIFTKRFENNNNVIKNKMSSIDFSQTIEDKSVDFIYIDGNHQYLSVKDDIMTWMPKIKDTGIISGHDYSWPTVKRALDECFGRNPDSVFEDGSWYYLKNNF